jgi:hypothetical protein
MPTDSEIVKAMARGMVNGDWEELPELHKVLALAQARKALAAQRAMGLVLSQGWQPIETAPRDGVIFLAVNHDREIYPAKYTKRGTLCFRMNGRYEPRKFELRQIDGEDWMKEDKEYAQKGECWRSDWVSWARLYEIAPTHWMPLPPPPIAAAQGEG